MLSRVKKAKRESGILLPLSSLPSNYGIGSLGIEAYRFIDFLRKSNQKYWQLLPLVPLGEGNSPYKSTSCFAGELLYIDLDFLVRDGLLLPEDLPKQDFTGKIDYEAVKNAKLPIIKKATEHFNVRNSDYARFLKANSEWLNDYALFMAITECEKTASLSEISRPLKFREKNALEDFKEKHKAEIRFHKIGQYLFYTQFFALKAYANANGIKLIGDIPFYVSPDSSDVWKSPENFKLDSELKPTLEAGVPPDIFSSSGQLWGNPVYDWDYQRENEYLWWQKRLAFCSKMYDVIRIDHFRAFASFYEIPANSPNAKNGEWKKGPGIEFWDIIVKKIGRLDIIAEDLGGEEKDVKDLIALTGFPNMKVLQFAFSSDTDNDFLPENYNTNCVCYTGTHDNDTVLGWYAGATSKERILFNRLTPFIDGASVPLRMINAAMKSKARLVIIPIQDWLCLNSDARINTPGTKNGNWEWRMNADAITDRLIRVIREYSRGRNLN